MIKAGDLWESVEHPSREPWHGAPTGLCIVVGPNIEGARESPDSYVMMRLTGDPNARFNRDRPGAILYMHRCARENGQWARRGALAVLEAE